MSLSTLSSRIQYTGNGATYSFSYPYYFLDKTHLRVVVTGTNGIDTVKTHVVDYSISGEGNPAGGTVVFIVPPDTGVTVTIWRETTFDQLASYVVDGNFPSATHEQAIDKLTMITQFLQLGLKRSIRVPLTNAEMSELIITARKSKIFGFDSNGNPAYYDPSAAPSDTIALIAQAKAEAIAAAAASSCQRSSNLSDVANVATARTNLGLGTAATHADGDYDPAGAAAAAQAAAASDATTKANAAQAAAEATAAADATAKVAAAKQGATYGNVTPLASLRATALKVDNAPTSTNDAVNKAYADSLAGTGLQPRTAVRVASTANVNRASVTTIDGVTLNTSDRVLLKNQTAPAENGIYTWAANALTRATDADTAVELGLNQYYLVTEGTSNVGTGWFILTAPATINVDPVAFGQFSSNAGALLKASNLSDIASPSTARTNLGLGTAAVQNSTAFDAAGQAAAAQAAAIAACEPINTCLRKSANLSDLSAAPTARDNLGLGTVATHNYSEFDVAGAAANVQAASCQRASNLSDVNSTSIARTNLGLGTAATHAHTDYDASGAAAAAQAAAIAASCQRASNLSDVANAGTARTNLGLGTVATHAHTDYDAAGAAAAAQAAAIAASCQRASNLSDVANKRTAKQNLNIMMINVRDFGAVGDGSTDDTTAINNAIAALTNYTTLYFPHGLYKITGGLTALSSLLRVTVRGDGWSSCIVSSVTGAAGNTFVVNTSCSYMVFRDLAIVGSATVRGSGIHIRLYSSYSKVDNCYFSGCSDFGVHVHNDTGGANAYSSVTNCLFNATLGDGVHFGAATDFICANNNFTNTGDDSIGVVADVLGTVPSRGLIANNEIIGSGSRGIALIDGPVDMLVTGNNIRNCVQSGIEVGRSASTTAYAYRMVIKGNKLYNCCTTSGPRAAIWVTFLNSSNVSENHIWDTANGGDICFLDFNELVIANNECRGAPSRSIFSDDTTTTNVAATWAGLIIQNNTIQWNQANQTIYVVPATGKQINNVGIINNYGNELPAGDWIYCARVSVGKICNNTSRDGRSITAGGLTTANNN